MTGASPWHTQPATLRSKTGNCSAGQHQQDAPLRPSLCSLPPPHVKAQDRNPRDPPAARGGQQCPAPGRGFTSGGVGPSPAPGRGRQELVPARLSQFGGSGCSHPVSRREGCLEAGPLERDLLSKERLPRSAALHGTGPRRRENTAAVTSCLLGPGPAPFAGDSGERGGSSNCLALDT